MQEVLVVENDALLAFVLTEALEEAGYSSCIASNTRAARTLIESGLSRFAGMITEVHLGEKFTGWSLADRAREKNANFPVNYLAEHSSEWDDKGVLDSTLVVKPILLSELRAAFSTLHKSREGLEPV